MPIGNLFGDFPVFVIGRRQPACFRKRKNLTKNFCLYGQSSFHLSVFCPDHKRVFSAYWRMAEKVEAIRAENRGENHCEFGSLMV